MSHAVVGLIDSGSKNPTGSGRNRGKRGRIQPYAWLGAGAVTLGLGAAMVAGSGVASADSDAGSSAATSASSSADTAGSVAGATGKSQAAARGHSARKATAASSASTNNRRASAVQAPETPDIDTSDVSSTTETVESATPTGASSTHIRTLVATEADDTAQPAAATPSPAAAPSLSSTSWIDPTTPGVHIALAKEQIAAAQAALNATWASGNILAGLASLTPSILLSQASLSLDLWGAFMPITQQMVAGTMNIPIIHQAAQISLMGAMAIPDFAIAQMNVAALFIPLVGIFGASTAADAANSLVSSAKINGRPYGVVPIVMKANTEPVVYITLDDGSRVPVLIDTGSSGLVISPTAVGTNFGTPIGAGSSGYSGGLTYDYTTYNAVVDFGNGVVTSPTAINVVDPEDAAAFDDYFYPAGVVGVLGIGANTAGPGPSVPNLSLPGELSDGVLIYQDLGVMVFGMNPLPVWETLGGSPNTNLVVKVGNNTAMSALVMLDSGGVYGTMPRYINGGSNSIPSGTRISVYTSDGSTLLYSYTTQGVNSPTIVSDSSMMNSGNEPFAQYPIYIDYSPEDGLGATAFTWF